METATIQIPSELAAEWTAIIQSRLDELGIGGRPLDTAQRRQFEIQAFDVLAKRHDAQAGRGEEKSIKPQTIGRIVRALVLAHAKQVIDRTPEAEAKRWQGILRRKIGALGKGPIGAADPGDVEQEVLQRLAERHLLRRTLEPFQSGYILKTLRNVLASAHEKANRDRDPKMTERSIVATKGPLMVQRHCPPSTEEILHDLPDPHDEEYQCEQRIDAEEIIKGLPRQQQMVIAVLGQVGGDHDAAAERLEEMRPGEQWNGKKVRRYKEAALDSARRRFVGFGATVGSVPADDQGSYPIPVVIDILLRGHTHRLFPLEYLHRKGEGDALIAALRALSLTDQEHVCGKLLDSYLAKKSDELTQVRRAETVYLLSQLRPGDAAFAIELAKKLPRDSERFLYRCFQVALSFLGDVGGLNGYATHLSQRRGAEGDEHREVNQRFHIYYYGSQEAALDRLRQGIKTHTPVNLLGLNVATLATMSADPLDLQILEEQREVLRAHGVEIGVIRKAEREIRQRATGRLH